MTNQELKEFMLHKFDAQDKRIDQLKYDLRSEIEKVDNKLEKTNDKLDKVTEYVTLKRGESVFSSKFWKHLAWIFPTTVALAALIKSIFYT